MSTDLGIILYATSNSSIHLFTVSGETVYPHVQEATEQLYYRVNIVVVDMKCNRIDMIDQAQGHAPIVQARAPTLAGCEMSDCVLGFQSAEIGPSYIGRGSCLTHLRHHSLLPDDLTSWQLIRGHH